MLRAPAQADDPVEPRPADNAVLGRLVEEAAYAPFAGFLMVAMCMCGVGRWWCVVCGGGNGRCSCVCACKAAKDGLAQS